MSSDLVPGDILEISSHGGGMYCDAVLLEGQAIMNESMLTGESVPITKTAAPREDGVLYDPNAHEKHTLKCGTRVIQTRRNQSARVTAIVTRTGYLTSKGDLVRSILYPYPVDFKFEKDSYKFIMVMAVIATAGMIYTLAKMIIDEEPWNEIVLEVFDLVTIVVPPALPAAMTIGVVIAQKRLERRGIFCISPRTINVSGSTDCVCFDKTGTITEDGMDMWGVVPTGLGLASATRDEPLPVLAEFGPHLRHVQDLPAQSNMIVGMATCHELNRIEGVVMGDPLDEKMFESTQWSLEQEEDKTGQVVSCHFEIVNCSLRKYAPSFFQINYTY
jgi:cation-transporting P-type ATPase 13A2